MIKVGKYRSRGSLGIGGRVMGDVWGRKGV